MFPFRSHCHGNEDDGPMPPHEDLLGRAAKLHASIARRCPTFAGPGPDQLALELGEPAKGSQAHPARCLTRLRLLFVLGQPFHRWGGGVLDLDPIVKRMAYADLKIVTLSEAEVTHLHVGLKGTMDDQSMDHAHDRP
jgi:hypothetical protein